MTNLLTRLDLRPVRPRDKGEPHRVASSLELFFDLVFVVAVSLASQTLHHLETDQQVAVGAGAYLMVFFAIWWAWMNFTWFATAFDNDDWLYRVTTIAQMAGVLVLAAGVSAAMEHGDFAAVTYGYVIMRLAMVSQWLRLAANSPEFRRTALRYAGGITVVQVAWVLRLLLPESLGAPSFVVLAIAELCVPVWAEHRQTTPYHNHHIAERFGLFTLVVLGEGLLGSANAIIDSLKDSEHIVPLVVLAICSLAIVASMWWVYFATPLHSRFGSLRQSLTLGYTHYVIFAAAAAMSAGIEVLVDLHGGATGLPPVVAAATLTVPVAVFVLAVWLLAIRPTGARTANTIIPLASLAIAASALLPAAEVFTAALLVVIVATLVVTGRRSGTGANIEE
ncbi:low temperature requirement protein A [Subtercola boreus]|uniref:Low temperature requirement protein A n=1 Tax=Subtercola boreus TaxID=120213 RepID=A0A3E0W903_9MICO|nr:low temperature requirement protein A [Subtercola boreus]RFA19072.1 low temperature requirement protein A [Subtercola boreus]RFA19210.1 low temperature requirement protein A [Subtercola boreus]RFA25672.1 low temperature requirement protein A [Subtercola boreus]